MIERPAGDFHQLTARIAYERWEREDAHCGRLRLIGLQQRKPWLRWSIAQKSRFHYLPSQWSRMRSDPSGPLREFTNRIVTLEVRGKTLHDFGTHGGARGLGC